jgi:hypothetical protein
VAAPLHTAAGAGPAKWSTAFNSHGNGTLSVIMEKRPTEFVLEETVKPKPAQSLARWMPRPIV